MTNIIASACSSAYDLCDQFFENIPENTHDEIGGCSFIHFLGHTFFTFNLQAALVNASLTAVALLTQAVVMSLLKTAGFDRMHYPFMLIFKTALPIISTGFIAAKCNLISKAQISSSNKLSLIINFFINFISDNDPDVKRQNCRTDNIRGSFFLISA